jgi:hypothetical protein
MDNYLLDADDYKAMSLTNTNVEDSIVRVTIQRVQRHVLQPVLTKPLYERFLQGVEDNDLNSDEVELLERYIQPYLACECDRKIINNTTYQIRNKAVNKGTDQYANPVNESENLRLDNSIRGDIEASRKLLLDYLIENKDLFPEYVVDCKPKTDYNLNIGFI